MYGDIFDALRYDCSVSAVSVCHAQPWLMSSMAIASSKTWIKRTSQSWKDWNTRVALGRINFPTNLEWPLAFSSENRLSCEIVIPMDDVANDEEFIHSLRTPTCPKDGRV